MDILKRAGLDVEVDSGVTDEGEPWFVFVRSLDGEVLAHFAQIDGQFVAVSSLNHEVYRGSDIRQIVDQMLDKHPLVVPKNRNSGQLSAPDCGCYSIPCRSILIKRRWCQAD